MRVIAYKTRTENGKVVLEESTGETKTSKHIMNLLTFLVEEFEDSDKDCLRVCWNLDTTVSVLLKLLGPVKCSQLKEKKMCHLAPFNVFYVPEKVFSVTHIPTKARANLYGIDQYFTRLEEPPGAMEVKLLTEKLLEELKKMGLTPTKLTSPVAIWEEGVMKTLDLPRVWNIPKKAAAFAYRASCRLWIETHQIGFWA